MKKTRCHPATSGERRHLEPAPGSRSETPWVRFLPPLMVLFLLVSATLFFSKAAEAATAGDLILYDGEPGSAPLLGGNWAIGAGGTILHNDGSGWAAVTSPVTRTLRGLDTTGDTQAWAAAAPFPTATTEARRRRS